MFQYYFHLSLKHIIWYRIWSNIWPDTLRQFKSVLLNIAIYMPLIYPHENTVIVHSYVNAYQAITLVEFQFLNPPKVQCAQQPPGGLCRGWSIARRQAGRGGFHGFFWWPHCDQSWFNYIEI